MLEVHEVLHEPLPAGEQLILPFELRQKSRLRATSVAVRVPSSRPARSPTIEPGPTWTIGRAMRPGGGSPHARSRTGSGFGGTRAGTRAHGP